MATAHFRFYEELNDFLPPARRKVEFSVHFSRCPSVKDMIESLGVPHPEIELILVNGQSVDFSYQLRNADRVSVYPVFESLDVTPLIRLREWPLRNPRFVVDCNLGRLARYLRLLGFDCIYRNDFQDADVARIADQQQRIVLTRDRRLLQRKNITHGLFIREVIPRRQVPEVLTRMDLRRLVSPFCRCTHCNALLEPVNKTDIEHHLEPKTRRYFSEFLQCPDCRRIYWKGSHHDRAQRLVEELQSAEWEFPE
ncbi:MAG: Mut7-C RNAse domain-containing protein [Thiogranum sp.]|nr:Mut7-C RNAse domain-containing protein [Thiogranum sp.]